MTHCRSQLRSILPVFALLFVCTLILLPGPAVARENEYTLTELRKDRKKLAQRKRRIIFNNDGDDVEGHGGPENNRTEESAAMTATPEGLLKLRTTALLDSQVDSIFYSSIYGMKLMYEASDFKRIYEFPDRKPERRKVAVRNCQALIANYGMDNLEVMIDCARKNGLEIFFSNRMNDNHDWYFPEFLSAIKARHPEYTIGHADANAKGTQTPEVTLQLMLQGKQGETALNFELQVIRDLTVEAMREVCRNYDIDGIDLDFFRFFKLFPVPVGPEHVAMLNDMMREMREMTEEEGLRRGRPILIAARGINSLERSLGFGMDFKAWLVEDLIDIVMPIHVSGHQGSLRDFIELAHRHGAPAYPCVRYHRAHQHSWLEARGEAMSRFAEGADGITTFNRFDPTHQLWWELGDPNVLRDLDKTYTCPHYLPVTVTDEGCKPLRLLVGEDVTSSPPAGKRRSLNLRVHVTGLTAARGMQVEFNDQRLQPVKKWGSSSSPGQDIWLEFLIEPAMSKVPENLLSASVKQEGDSVTIDDVELDVLYVDAETVQLAADGKTDYEIVLADEPAVQVRAAADELAEFLQQVTGAEFPIVKASSAQSEYQIFVGRSDALAGLNLPIDWSSLGPEGFVIQTMGKNLIIAGGPRRGSINAVYTFLEDVIGCRWYTPKFSVIPSKKVLSIDPLDIRKVPDFDSRQTWRYMSPHGTADADWLARQRLNMLHPGERWYPLIDSNPKLAGCTTYIESFGHTLGHSKLLPYAEFEKHPEYFALIDGKRVKTGQPCMTNPDVLRFVVKNAKTWLKNDTRGSILSISQPDGDFEISACQCPKCSAAFEKYGRTGALMRFVNRVAALCLTGSAVEGGFQPDVFYIRQNGLPGSGGTYDLFRNEGTTLAEEASNIEAAGLGDRFLGLVATAGGDVVVGRQEGTDFDLLRYDGKSLTQFNAGYGLTGIDDGILEMVATADGAVVILRQNDGKFDLLRYDVDPEPGAPYHPNIGQERTGYGLADIDDGILEIVATTSGHVVVLRKNASTFDLLRYDTDPPADNPGYPQVVEVNQLRSAAGVDDGILGMVATADDHVVVARQYDGQLDLLRYDTDPLPESLGYPGIAEVNRGTALAGLDDGVLGIVATAGGDVVIARHHAGVASILRCDVDPPPGTRGHPHIVEAARNDSAMPLEDGFLGMAALGNGNIVMARDNAGVIELFVYDGITLAATVDFLNAGGGRGVDDGLLGITGFVGKVPALSGDASGDGAFKFETDYSDILIDTFAYHWTRKPPQDILMHKNVVVRYSPGGAICYHHAFDQCNYNNSEEAYEDLLEWLRISPHVWVWYYAHGGDKMHPLPHFSSLSRNFKLMRDAGVEGLFVQTDHGEERIESGGLLDLQSYILAKLMWDPDYDVQNGIEEFCRACYAAGAPYIISFVKLVNDADTYTGTPLQHYTETEVKQFPGFHCPGGATVAIRQDKLAEMDRLFEDAESAVADDPDSLERIRLVRLAAQYVIMLYAENDDPLRAKAIREFFPLAEKQGITKLRLPVNRREVSVDAFREVFLGLKTDRPD
jgi:hypothetical protein